MEKTLRILAALGVICVGAVIWGQRAAVGTVQGGSGAQVASKDESVYRATHPAASLNAVQNALVHYFINRQNHLIELAKSTNREEAVKPIIVMLNYHMLTTMTKNQQTHEIEDVLQIDKWVPGDHQWAQVAKAPSLANEILKVSPENLKKIQAFEDKISDEWMKPFREMSQRIWNDPANAKLSTIEKQKLLTSENAKLYVGKSMTARAFDAVVRAKKTLDFARSLLTKEQRAEYDKFIADFDRDMNIAIQGKVSNRILN